MQYGTRWECENGTDLFLTECLETQLKMLTTRINNIHFPTRELKTIPIQNNNNRKPSSPHRLFFFFNLIKFNLSAFYVPKKALSHLLSCQIDLPAILQLKSSVDATFNIQPDDVNIDWHSFCNVLQGTNISRSKESWNCKPLMTHEI